MNANPKIIEAEPQGTGHAPTTPTSVMILPETRDVTPLTLLDRALSMGADPATLREFMELQERHERNQARKAFSAAFAAFKAEAIIIERNRKVTDGPLKGKRYAELIAFVEAAVPLLSKHGLSHSWSITKDEKDWIEVTCTIEHVLGGSKTATLGGPPDTGGAKNALQARVSTVTYLERATFKAACGLAEQGDDDDGRGGGGGPAVATPEQVEKIRAKIVESGSDLKKFLGRFVVEKIEDLSAAQAERAIVLLDAKIAADTKPKEPAP
jgi:hypothetical protein